jgi:hypothetical protein
VGRMLGVQAGSKVLGTKHTQVLRDPYHLGLSQEMVDGRGLVATCDEAHGHVLYKLEFLHIGRFAVWKPNRRSVAEDRVNKGFVSKRSLLIMAPGGATNRLQDVDALGSLSSDGQDVVTETKHCIKCHPKDFWGPTKRDSDAVNGDVRPGVTLLCPRSKQGNVILREQWSTY